MGEDPATLAIPPWVHPLVAQKARELYKHPFGDVFGMPNCKTVVQRLATDHRMEKVWGELRQRKRQEGKPTKAYYYTATVPEFLDPPGDPSGRQGAAMAHIFLCAVIWATHGTAHLLQPKPHPKSREWRKTANLIEADAAEIRRFGAEDFAERLADAAFAYRELASNPIMRDGRQLFVDQRGSDVEARGFAVVISDVLNVLFCPPPHQKRGAMLKTVSTVASVALGREITDSAVREWCQRGVWAKRLHSRD